MSMFNVALSGLNAAQQALTTTSHNIANANNPDYTRQEVVVSSVEGAASGNGVVGRGVSVQNVRRLDNDFLSERLEELASQLGFSETRANQLNELDRISSNSDTSLEGAVQAFFQAAQDLSVRPDDNSLKQNFIFAADDVANRLNNLISNADTLRTQSDSAVTDSVRRINTLSEQIAELNLQISDSTSFQGSLRIEPNDLIDRRDALLKDLSGEIEIQTTTLDNGRININTRLGVPLVSEGKSYPLELRSSPTGSGQVEVVRKSSVLVDEIVNGVPTGKKISQPLDIVVPAREFGTSRLGALMTFRDKDLKQYAESLEGIGTRIRLQANAIQTEGNKPALFTVNPQTGKLGVNPGFTSGDIAIQTVGNGNNLILKFSNLFNDSSNGKSIIQEYRELTTSIGNRAAAAKSDVTAKSLIRDQVEADRSSFSGVNLDEEAANLLRYQQAYSASGKVISISQDLFRELLEIAGK